MKRYIIIRPSHPRGDSSFLRKLNAIFGEGSCSYTGGVSSSGHRWFVINTNMTRKAADKLLVEHDIIETIFVEMKNN